MNLWDFYKELELLATVHGWETPLEVSEFSCCYGDLSHDAGLRYDEYNGVGQITITDDN